MDSPGAGRPGIPAARVSQLLLVLVWMSAAPSPAEVNYDESQVPAYQLPDPLVMSDGRPVRSSAQWWQERRPEILRQFQEQMYGVMPDRAVDMQVQVVSLDASTLVEGARRKEVRLHFPGLGSEGYIQLLIYLPPVGEPRSRVPVFLGYNFQGNHTIHADPGITKSRVWERAPSSGPRVPGDDTRGSQSRRWPVELILQRGYGIATAYYGDVDPDFDDGFRNGVHPLFPELQQRDDNWSAIGAWAWGLSRMLDYLQTEDAVDERQVIVWGHSRLGKTALWAGATDQRFAAAISNNSGCGGAALSRRRFGETVERINTAFPHWFCRNFRRYHGREEALPIDQHQLLALIAPRPVYVASAEQDRWADPRGEFLAALHADAVYRWLGCPGLGAREMPPVDVPITGIISYHMRSGKHDVTRYDWERYLDFADRFVRSGEDLPSTGSAGS